MGSGTIDEEAVIQRLLQLNERYQAQWDADLAAVRVLVAEEESLPLRMGDLFNELKTRWNGKMPDLAREAGVSPHTARQRARIAARFPNGSRPRSLGLPFSILRLLAPLADPEPWAERARDQQSAGELHVRTFARQLEDAGLRRRRPRRPPHCLHCGTEIAPGAERVSVRLREQTGQLCGAQCATAYFAAPLPTRSPAATPPHAAGSPQPLAAEPSVPTRSDAIPGGEAPVTLTGKPAALDQRRQEWRRCDRTGALESHPLAPPRHRRADEETRILAALAVEEEAGIGRFLSRSLNAALPPPPEPTDAFGGAGCQPACRCATPRPKAG
jgi:hypothetical protein